MIQNRQNVDEEERRQYVYIYNEFTPYQECGRTAQDVFLEIRKMGNGKGAAIKITKKSVGEILTNLNVSEQQYESENCT